MSLLNDLLSKIISYSLENYVVEDTSIVPETDYSKLTFGNKGLTSDFAFLFVDIRKSSQLVNTYGYIKAAKIYQSFHEINVRIIAINNGAIRAFDGDRVMGVFAGDNKNTNATKAGMQILWGVRNILNKVLETSIVCGVGVDYGKTLVTKVGKGRNSENYDLVWVGEACNYASHLANQANNSIILSDRSYNKLNEVYKVRNGSNIWIMQSLVIKDKNIVAYTSHKDWPID